MSGQTAGLVGMVVGALGLMVAGLIDAYTHTLLVCGSVIFSSGMLAVAISSRCEARREE